jgi:predicted P-loop ATPase/GTPase
MTDISSFENEVIIILKDLLEDTDQYNAFEKIKSIVERDYIPKKDWEQVVAFNKRAYNTGKTDGILEEKQKVIDAIERMKKAHKKVYGCNSLELVVLEKELGL